MTTRAGRSGYLNVFRDNSTGRAEEERRALLLAETGHRLKNLLATVQAVATQTLRAGEVPQEVQDNFDARVLALARSHDLLVQGSWKGAPLAELVAGTLAPYGGEGRATLSGPPVQLPANAVEMLCLAFHELATNAAKHGALSVPQGRVAVRWDAQPEGVRDPCRGHHLAGARRAARRPPGRPRLRIAPARARADAELRRHGPSRRSSPTA